MSKSLRPFRGTCRGKTCGADIWMVPITKRDGTPGWAPMDLDEDDPDAVPEDWDPERSHYHTCPDADQFSRSRKG